MSAPTTFHDLQKLAESEGTKAMYAKGEQLGHPFYSSTAPLGLNEWTCPVCGDYLKRDERRGIAFKPCDCIRQAYVEAMMGVFKQHRPGVVKAELSRGGVPDRYLEATFANFKPRPGTEEATRACREYARDFDPGSPVGFCLQGPTGSGKTHLATATVRAIMEESNLVPLFVEAIHFLSSALSRKFGDQDPVQKYLEAELLVLDDLGAHRINDSTTDEIYRLIAGRYAANRPTIVTTNYAYDDDKQSFLSAFGSGFRSRMIQMCPAVVCNATDFREEG